MHNLGQDPKVYGNEKKKKKEFHIFLNHNNEVKKNQRIKINVKVNGIELYRIK